MGLSRRLLFRSAVWEVSRPKTPLTEGHLLVRLSDPSVDFTLDSAADWLLCHNIARQALSSLLGGDRCGLMFAYEWHPLGDAIGEPAAESSTPTFHLFGRWDGESSTPAEQLSLPASRRIPPSEYVLSELDAELRAVLQREAVAFRETAAADAAADAAEGGPGTTFDPPPRVAEATPIREATPAPKPQLPVLAKWKAHQEPGSGHRIFSPVRAISRVSDVRPDELLALATGLLALPRYGGSSGFSCIAAEATDSDERLQLHALGRSPAEAVNPLEAFLRSPEVSHALL